MPFVLALALTSAGARREVVCRSSLPTDALARPDFGSLNGGSRKTPRFSCPHQQFM